MKKSKFVSTVLLFVLIFASCVTVLEPPKSNTDYLNIIGKPFKIGNIEVAEYDFPKKMNWEDAKKACADLGEGWRLPSKDELNYLYQNRVAFDNGGFASALYWSSTEVDNVFAWVQDFGYGSRFKDDNKSYPDYVRAVRFEGVIALEPPKSNTDYLNIIGKPIKIANIEVAQYDFPKEMNWEDAKIFCADLGEGWKLPSRKELNILYQNKYKIGGFGQDFYWSSTDLDTNTAWIQDFFLGSQQFSANKVNGYKYVAVNVRAIRVLEQSAALEPPESNTDYKNIIGKPIKIGNIEVAQYDFPDRMNWNDAKIACEALGDGWRLPSLNEFDYLYQNRVAGGFANSFYWSSTEVDNDYARGQGFSRFDQSEYQKANAASVRAVRSF